MTAGAPTPEHIMQIGMGFWASKTLLSAVEMEVFTELAKHPEDLATLTGRLGLHPRSSRDFLDSLVALGFLDRKDGRPRESEVLARNHSGHLTDGHRPRRRGIRRHRSLRRGTRRHRTRRHGTRRRSSPDRGRKSLSLCLRGRSR